MSSQPVWNKVGTVGDVNPIDYGGGIVLVDGTGVYPPEVEYYEPIDPDREASPVKVYRFVLYPCTYVNGVLSDNKYHPDHAVWFADDVHTLASQFEDMADDDLIGMFCSDDPMERAFAWLEVGMYNGLDNLDDYPLTMSYSEAENRLERYSA